MDELQQIVMDTVLSTIAEKVDPKLLRRANTRELRKKLAKNLTMELFYKLLKDGKLNLVPGFGSVLLKDIKEKNKKIYDRKTGQMVSKRVKGRKVVYKPGDTLRELL
jgi:hypothetical protein